MTEKRKLVREKAEEILTLSNDIKAMIRSIMAFQEKISIDINQLKDRQFLAIESYYELNNKIDKMQTLSYLYLFKASKDVMIYGQKVRTYSRELFNLPLTTKNVIKEIGEIEVKLEKVHNELETAITLLYLKEGSPDWL